jgi:hypothetical protein
MQTKLLSLQAEASHTFYRHAKVGSDDDKANAAETLAYLAMTETNKKICIALNEKNIGAN